MPKVVDHEQRRQQCTDALWRVVSRDGPSAISVRSVAAEAGMSPTNLTHYFPSRAEMLAAVVQRQIAAGVGRADRIGIGDLDIDTAIELVAAVIPTTAERRRQSQVWLLLVHEQHFNPLAGALLGDIQRTVYRTIVAGLRALAAAGNLGAGRDVELEARRLHGLIDGLSLQSVSDPRAMSTARVRRIVELHMRELVRPRAGAD